VLILPACDFRACELFPDQLKLLADASAAAPLVVFTSPRAVEHGLAQLPANLLAHCRVAAIGPTTAGQLRNAGIAVALQAEQGHTTEDLLAVVPAPDPAAPDRARDAFILTAPGGRGALADGLRSRGYRPRLLPVYERKPADLDAATVESLRAAERVLSIWTSAEAMHSLAQRLPAECWKRVCAGEWLVISGRLARVARSFSPAEVHIAPGPSNADLVRAVRALGSVDAGSG
jgi:uroporphyrinogen-III synthase